MYSTSLIYVSFLGMFTVIGTLGNALIMIVYGVKKRRKMSTDYYIVALAVADFVAVSLLIYVIVFNADLRYLTDFSCKFFQFLRRCTAIASITLTALTACDRYVIVCQPFGIRTNLKRCSITIISGIAYSTISQLFWPIYGNALEVGDTKICAYTGPKWLGMMNGVNSACICGFATVLCAVLYTKIYLKIKHHKKKTGNLNQRPEPSRTRASYVSGTMEATSDVTRNCEPFFKKFPLKKNRIHIHDETSQDIPLERNVTDVTRIASGLVTNGVADFLDEGPSTSIRTISNSRMGPEPKWHQVDYSSAPIRTPSPNEEGTGRCQLPRILLNQKADCETACDTNLCSKDSKDMKCNQEGLGRKNRVNLHEKSSGFRDDLLPEQECDNVDSPYLPVRVMTEIPSLPGNVPDEIQVSITNYKNQLQSPKAVAEPSNCSVIHSEVSHTGDGLSSERPRRPVPNNEGRYSTGNGQRKPREDSMTRMLLMTTVIFFVTTLPAVCLENTPSHKLNSFQGTRFGEGTVMFLSLIRFVNHVVNVFVYGLVNARFRKEALKVICRKK